MSDRRLNLQEIHDSCLISINMLGRNSLTSEPVERLPPRLWEQFRLELQNKYRAATGEEHAVLTVTLEGDGT